MCLQVYKCNVFRRELCLHEKQWEMCLFTSAMCLQRKNVFNVKCVYTNVFTTAMCLHDKCVYNCKVFTIGMCLHAKGSNKWTCVYKEECVYNCNVFTGWMFLQDNVFTSGMSLQLPCVYTRNVFTIAKCLQLECVYTQKVLTSEHVFTRKNVFN